MTDLPTLARRAVTLLCLGALAAAVHSPALAQASAPGGRMATAMQAPLQIAFHNLDASEAVKGLIEDRVAWLERFCGRITGCRTVAAGSSPVSPG